MSLCIADLPWLSDSPKYRLTFRDSFFASVVFVLASGGVRGELTYGLCSGSLLRPSHSLQERLELPGEPLSSACQVWGRKAEECNTHHFLVLSFGLSFFNSFLLLTYF